MGIVCHGSLSRIGRARGPPSPETVSNPMFRSLQTNAHGDGCSRKVLTFCLLRYCSESDFGARADSVTFD